MSLNQIEFEVHIDIPAWLSKFKTFVPPSYRIYADDELILERTYDFYLDNQFVLESINLDLETDYHTVKLEQTQSSLTDVKLYMKNLTVNGSRHHLSSVTDQQIMFHSR